MRLRLDLAYDGTDFRGWATQPGLRTVQGELEAALATVLRVPAVHLTVAGRTDTGVHARGQVAHFDISDQRDSGLGGLREGGGSGQNLAAAGVLSGRPEASATPFSEPPETPLLLRKVNGVLPLDIRVHRVSEVSEAFDARFSALSRRYIYRVADRPELVDPLLRGHVLFWPRALDLSGMNLATAELTGLHDFATFCKAREGGTTIRNLQRLEWSRGSTGLAELTVVADAFCHNMVRSLVGCLLAVGDGRAGIEWARELLTEASRVNRPGRAPIVAPANGLTLEEVVYPPEEQWADRLLLTMRRRDRDETEGAGD